MSILNNTGQGENLSTHFHFFSFLWCVNIGTQQQQDFLKSFFLCYGVQSMLHSSAKTGTNALIEPGLHNDEKKQ